jgi:hypothetical protein
MEETTMKIGKLVSMLDSATSDPGRVQMFAWVFAWVPMIVLGLFIMWAFAVYSIRSKPLASPPSQEQVHVGGAYGPCIVDPRWRFSRRYRWVWLLWQMIECHSKGVKQ